MLREVYAYANVYAYFVLVLFWFYFLHSNLDGENLEPQLFCGIASHRADRFRVYMSGKN